MSLSQTTRIKGAPIGAPRLFLVQAMPKSSGNQCCRNDTELSDSDIWRTDHAFGAGYACLAAVAAAAAATTVIAAAAVVIVVVAVVAATAAVAEDQKQNDDPPPVVTAEAAADTVIVAHKITST